MRFHFLASTLLMGSTLAPGAEAQSQIPMPIPARAPSPDTHISDRELFEMLDDSRPELAAMQKMARTDMASAKRDLAAYFRARTDVPWRVSTLISDRKAIKWDAKAAQDAVDGNVDGGLVKIKHQFPGGVIDWNYNATHHIPGEPHNSEWQWQLNRMSMWGRLRDAYAATGDEKYAQAWVRQLRSWSEQSPPPRKAEHGAPSTWRPIEAGIRMFTSWPDAFYRFLASPWFGDDDIALFLRTALEHGRYLHDFPSGGNHLTMEMNGLYTVGALFPEFKPAAKWRQFAVKTLATELQTQFLPDGAQVELTPPYHFVALDNILAIQNTARTTRRSAELPANYVKGAERAYDFGLHLMTPDRSLPKFNDSWPTNMSRILEGGHKLFPNRRDYEWIATDGKSGTSPARTSHAFDWAGYYVMREGWNRDANYLAFDAGPLGFSHRHQDKLNFVIYPYGRELLFDSGGGSYEKSKFRDYATDTFGHNCVLVDGQPQRRVNKWEPDEKMMKNPAYVSQKPIEARWQSNADFDFAAGIYNDGWGRETDKIATQTRRVLFVKPDIWIVADTLAPNDDKVHTYQARWNLLSTSVGLDSKTLGAATGDAGMPNLAVVPLLRSDLKVEKVSAQTEPEILGWDVRKDKNPQYVPATTLLHTRKGAGQQHFLTLFVPLRAGQTSPIQSVRENGELSAEVTLRDGTRWLIRADADPKGAIRATELGKNGQVGRRIVAGEAKAAQTARK